MKKLRTKAFFYILFIILIANLSFLFFLFQVLPEMTPQLRAIIFASGLTIFLLSIIGATAISLILSRGITRPINEIIKATRAISKRDFNHYIKIHTYSEIEDLIFNFNYMVKQLRDFEQRTKKHNQDLEKIIRARKKELSYIYRIGREISSTLKLDEVLDTIVKRTTEVLDLKVCVILLVKEVTADKLQVLRTEGISLKKIEGEYLGKGEGISGWVWKREEALLIKDISQDSRFIGRKKERYYTGSLISVPLEVKGKIIGIINGNNKIDSRTFNEEDLLLLKEISTESAIAIENALLYKNLKEIYLHTISALARALDAKDHYTKSHSENVTKYAVFIAKGLGLDEPQIEVIREACELHDLGKIGIHDYILAKSGDLSMDEWREIRMHSLRGAQILQPIDFLTEVAELVRQHHERFDGKGYPYNLSGQDIQLGARIMAVADSFDAMISERPYRKAMSLSEAIKELKANSGTQFDPTIVRTFLKLLKTKPDLTKVVVHKKISS